MKKLLIFLITHGIALAIGFAGGIYVLPILTAPPAPENSEITAMAGQARFSAEFRRDLAGSDFLHWGEGKVSITPAAVALQGKLAPGPDYKLYFSPEFVDNKADFLRLKAQMLRVGDVKTFENFVVPLPAGVDPAAYNSVVVWCETFEAFITAAKYQ